MTRTGASRIWRFLSGSDDHRPNALFHQPAQEPCRADRQREGWKDNHKRVYRFYRELGLSLRHHRPKRNKAADLRQPKKQSSGINDIWSMDFVADTLFDGRRLRTLPVVDNYTSECLAIDVGQSLKGEDVVRVLEQLRITRGLPKTIKVDNGMEFISKAMDKWAYEHGVELDFSAWQTDR